MTSPTADEQILFLQHMQRLFDEGEFQATYKYALLLSVAELAVELGDDSGKTLDLSLRLVGEKFTELYWRQLAPYGTGQPETVVEVLSQNLGTQASAVKHLLHVHSSNGGRLSDARSDRERWRKVATKITRIVSVMPVQHLQVIGGKQVQFLYEYPIVHRKLTLKPGVAFNLRRYQPLVQQLARAAWIDHVRRNKRNAPMLGQIDDLESFMFGSGRNILVAVAPVLARVQDGRCFYCGKAISRNPEVDHFIPWSRYPRDTAHNFVLADAKCNNQKRGMLAARLHLEHWLEQIDRHGQEIGTLLAAEGFIADVTGSVSVTRWAYQQAASASGNAWISGKLTEPVGSAYLQVLGA